MSDAERVHQMTRSRQSTSNNKKTKVNMTTPQARRRRAKMKAAALAVKQEAKNAQVQQQLDEWFEKFDENGDQQFDRKELQALLAHINPGFDPTEEVIDMVMRDATGVYQGGHRSSAGVYGGGGGHTGGGLGRALSSA